MSRKELHLLLNNFLFPIIIAVSYSIFLLFGKGNHMQEFLNIIRQLFSGKRTIDNRIKYQTISGMIGLVHLIYASAFFALRVNILFIYNMLAVIFYMIVAYLFGRSKKLRALFISAYIEIMFHSIIATTLIGWDFGFMIYTITMLPLAFYISYTTPAETRSAKIPSFISLMTFIAYFVTLIFVRNNPPLLGIDLPESGTTLLYYFNTLMAFSYVWIISVLFTVEVAYMQHNLESENTSLEKLANFDPLTKLLNRRSMNTHLKEALEKAIEQDETFSIIMTDIDNFKHVNDTYGHAAGDEVLVKISDILVNSVREEDIVCRWGGEEMLILIKADNKVAYSAAERIRQDVEDAVTTVDGKKIKVTMTLGISGYKKGDNIRSMVQKADICLYKGKNSGKNQVVMV